MNFKTYSYRFADQVLNSKLAIKQELESILHDTRIRDAELSRPYFNKLLLELFTARGWTSEAPVFDEPGDPSARMDFLKERIGIEVGFGHASFIGIDLLKFQMLISSNPQLFFFLTHEFLFEIILQNFLISN